MPRRAFVAALLQQGYAMPISTRKGFLPDGIYGDETKAAVEQFQRDFKGKKLGRDGIAGKNTLHALDGLLTQSTPTNPKPIKPPSDPHYTLGTGDPTIRHDPGAGAWASRAPELSMQILKDLLLEGMPAFALKPGPDAARHLRHYFGRTGRDLEFDAERLVKASTRSSGAFAREIGEAKRFVEMLPPGTHLFKSKTPQSSNAYDDDNWYYGVGGYSKWGSGKVVVSGAAPNRQYRMEFTYHLLDRYNWDTGKSVEFLGIEITDHFMGEFHRQGMAREFVLRGTFDRTFTWKQGEPIPMSQLAL